MALHGVSAVADRGFRPSDQAASRLAAVALQSPNASVERLAMNLRAYAHSRGAPAKDDDEAAALVAARGILAAMEKQNEYAA